MIIWATPMQPELCRNDKKAEQQKNGRPVDPGNDIGSGNVAENHHRDGAEQGDADAIKEFKPGTWPMAIPR